VALATLLFYLVVAALVAVTTFMRRDIAGS
jgi:hypothetical protein